MTGPTRPLGWPMPLCWVCGEEIGYEDDTILARLTPTDAEFAHIRCVPEDER